METEATSGHEDTLRPMQPLAIGSAATAATSSAATAATGVPQSFGDAETMRPTPDNASPRISLDYPALVSIDPQHYVTGQQLARGGMGRIRVARDRRLGRDVAIKELLVTTPELRTRFEREARITAKLQHPAIVGVLEAGTWPSGEPFYAMELVAGKSLDKAIAQCATSRDRLALLPNVIAVADALAYAHGRRVIHRDLKPANVLVGEFGETVVIDWGLAKDLTDAEAPDLLVGPYRGGAQPGETEAGAVMGTPQYMPIEQAEGENVDERADVYALGAMLYHVLAGVAPYATGSADAVLTAVLAGPPQSLATRGLELPADLIAIVDKAMAREAADRYPTAKQLAEDLKKFQTGQLVAAHRYTRLQLALRWLRRHRAASVAALAIVAVVSVAGQRVLHAKTVSDGQRDLAIASRAQAGDLLQFMIGDLQEKLRPIGRLDVLDAVAQKAIAYFAQSDQLTLGELAVRGRVIGDLGLLAGWEGHHGDALARYRDALGVNESLYVAQPYDLDRTADLGDQLRMIAGALQDQGDLLGARAALNQGAAIIDALHAAVPEDHRFKKLEVGIHRARASLSWNAGRPADAIPEAALALSTAEAVADATPPDEVMQRYVVDLDTLMANAYHVTGDPTHELAVTRRGLASGLRYAAQHPGDLRWQAILADAHAHLGNALQQNHQLDAASSEYQSALTILRASIAHDGENTTWQDSLLVALSGAGTLADARKDERGAEAAFREMIEVAGRLVAKEPARWAWRHALAEAHGNLGQTISPRDPKAGLVELHRRARHAGDDPGARSRRP